MDLAAHPKEKQMVFYYRETIALSYSRNVPALRCFGKLGSTMHTEDYSVLTSQTSPLLSDINHVLISSNLNNTTEK